MQLGSHDLDAWLDRSPGHQLYRTRDGALLYRFLPTAPDAARDLLRPTFDRLVAALSGPGHPGLPRLAGPASTAPSPAVGSELLLAVHDVEGWPAARLTRGLLPEEALGLAARVLRALRPLHTGGLFHGGLTPSRILLTSGGAPVLFDAGAALMAEAHPNQRLAPPLPGFLELYPEAGLVPPELFHKRALGPQTDVFLVAVLAFRWLTGHSPYGAGGRTLATYGRVRDGQHEPFPASSGLTDLQLVRLLTASLAPDPDARPRPDELEAALAPFAAVGVPEARTPGPSVPWSRAFKVLPPEDAPGPPGSPAEERRQEALRRAALQLDLMRGHRPDRRAGRSKVLIVSAVLLLGALALAIPLMRGRMAASQPQLPGPTEAPAEREPPEEPPRPRSGHLAPPDPDRPTGRPIRFAPPRRRPPEAERTVAREAIDRAPPTVTVD